LGGEGVAKLVENTTELEDILVSSKTLEALFGVADRTVRHLADEGIIKRDSHGKYLLWNSANSYITALKVMNAGRTNSKTEDEAYNLDLEKAQHEHIKRQITDIKLQLIKGQVHKAEDVEKVMSNMFARFKSKMTALPSKLAPKLEGKPRTEIQKILKKEVDAALTELSSYSPQDFYSDEHIDISDEAISSLGVDDDYDE
jgi:phage terminase Nu1 subunit (DNA packaging protein)